MKFVDFIPVAYKPVSQYSQSYAQWPTYSLTWTISSISYTCARVSVCGNPRLSIDYKPTNQPPSNNKKKKKRRPNPFVTYHCIVNAIFFHYSVVQSLSVYWKIICNDKKTIFLIKLRSKCNEAMQKINKMKKWMKQKETKNE